MKSVSVEYEMTQAITDVIAERQRQVTAEGWTPQHDDEHQFGELAAAGACYAMPPAPNEVFPRYGDSPPRAWPYDAEWWKPKDRRRDLVRAAALIVAEIDRIDRMDARKAKQP